MSAQREPLGVLDACMWAREPRNAQGDGTGREIRIAGSTPYQSIGISDALISSESLAKSTTMVPLFSIGRGRLKREIV